SEGHQPAAQRGVLVGGRRPGCVASGVVVRPAGNPRQRGMPSALSTPTIGHGQSLRTCVPGSEFSLC
ncbi:hypothetical protein, partial [Corynebacterium diphtheriae]|uniref:hypothetical protein n=1 Tax=Corynebacterium diphtheriae TaxID=1717 RepID=UPI001A7E0583